MVILTLKGTIDALGVRFLHADQQDSKLCVELVFLVTNFSKYCVIVYLIWSDAVYVLEMVAQS